MPPRTAHLIATVNNNQTDFVTMTTTAADVSAAAATRPGCSQSTVDQENSRYSSTENAHR